MHPARDAGPPLVVTLALSPEGADALDALRRAHFPPERNHLAAHLTLFHALPGAAEPAVLDVLVRLAAGQAPFSLALTGYLSLGRGVALRVDAPPLLALHRRAGGALADVLAARGEALTRQDAAALRPHVTVANKIPPPAARALLARLAAGFQPWSVGAVGLDVWHYLGGPWRHVSRVTFAGGAPGPGSAAEAQA